MSLSVSTRRRVRAIALVAGLLVAIPASGLVVDSGYGVARAQASDGLRASSVIDGLDPYGSLERIEQVAAGAEASLPPYFEEEIGLVEGARDLRADSSGLVVGYVLDMPCDQAAKAVSAHMEEAGWSEVELGGVSGATFVKEGGSCTWTLVTCTQAGSATSVVYRSVAR